MTAFAVVVTYEPEPEVRGNLEALLAEGLSVVVVDNSASSPPLLVDLERLGVEVIRNGRNLGVASALNNGVSRCIDRGAEWIFTFDQDSRVTEGFKNAMLQAWADAEQRFADVALVAPAYRDQRSGRMLSRTVPGDTVSLVHDSMTSGNLVKPETFQRVGFYADDYFIDYVDTEFCLRCRRAGMAIVQANRAVLDHNLGDTRWFDVLGVQFKVCEQSTLRRYYMMRNRTRTYFEFASTEPRWFLKELRTVGFEEVKMLLFEKDRLRKLRSQALGLAHALRGRAGPLR